MKLRGLAAAIAVLTLATGTAAIAAVSVKHHRPMHHGKRPHRKMHRHHTMHRYHTMHHHMTHRYTNHIM